MVRYLREYLIKGSNNKITLTLLEDEEPISVSWTALHIDFHDQTTGEHVLRLTRTSSEGGISLSTAGVLEINPGELDESTLDELEDSTRYRVYVTVVSTSSPDGVVFGADDSKYQQRLLITVSDPGLPGSA